MKREPAGAEAMTTDLVRAARRRRSSRPVSRNSPASTKAVVLAGGRGTRLAPYTSVLPKPLMPVGERAILELVVDQLEAHGITDITFCVGYLAHLIQAVFDRRDNGHVTVTYVHEQVALGTAGPLRLVPEPTDSFIVMNGDVLTNLDYRELVEYHRRHENALTIATLDRSVRIDYGVLHLNGHASGPCIVEYEEKPEIGYTVSMGIYVLEPWVIDLVQSLLHGGHRVGAYRYDGLWFDIGRKEDYELAVTAWLEQQALRPEDPAQDDLRLAEAG
jgi:NDP-sugar pyrophosphorylase family protein